MRKSTPFLRLAASTALATALIAPGAGRAQELPTGANVTRGLATFDRSVDNQLGVNLRTAGTIIEWNSFGIGRVPGTGNTPEAPNVVSFNSLLTRASVLNRVTGSNPSNITGSLTSGSNVSVYLINPNGITFGAGANVNVGALIASTLNISDDDDFTNGGLLSGLTSPRATLRFAGAAGATAGIRLNGGTITTANGGTGLGQLVLLGAFVGRPDAAAPTANQAGSTQTGGSDVAFVAGTDITMTRSVDSPLAFTITRGTTVQNAIHADGRVNGENVTLAMATADAVQDAILNVSGTVTATVATGTNRGVVLAAGNVSVPDIAYGSADTGGLVSSQISGSLVSRSRGEGVIVQSSLDAGVSGAIDASRIRIGGQSVTLGIGANPAVLAAIGSVDISAGTGGITGREGTIVTANSGNAAAASPLTLEVIGSGGGIAFAPGSTLRGGTNRSADVLIYAPDTAVPIQLGNVEARGFFATSANRSARAPIERTGALTLGNVTVTAPLSLTAAGIIAGDLSSDGTLTLAAPGVIDAASLTATGALSVSGAGALGVTGQVQARGAGGDVIIDRGGPVMLGVIAAGRDLSIGGVAAPASLTVDGASSAERDFRVVTSGAQTYTGAATFGRMTTLTSTAGGDINFASAVNGASALAVNTSGVGSFDGEVGGNTPLLSLTTDGGGTTRLGRSVTTSGAQAYGDAVSLSGNTTLTGTVPSFASTVTGNGFDLALDFSGTTNINGGFTGIRNLSTGRGGITILQAGIATTGSQIYNDAVLLRGDTMLDAGAAVTIAGTLNSDMAARALTVNTGGATTFGGAVGGTPEDRLASLTVNGGGTAAINGGVIGTVGAQRYNTPITLGANTALTGSAGSFAAVSGNGFDLALDFAGTTAINGGFTGIRNLSTGGSGTTSLQGSITTSGSQSYGNAVVLGADTILGAGAAAVSFASTIDSDATARALTVNTTGTTTFNAAVGSVGSAAGRLASLTISGATVMNGGAVRTTGAQAYGGTVTLASDMVIDAAAGALTFATTLDSDATPRNLAINSTGTTTFGGLVGSTTATRLASLTTDTGGTTAINGGAITTMGAQTYGDAVTLGADTVLTGTSGRFTTLAGNGFNLALNFSDSTSLGGNFTGVGFLSTGGGGTTSLQGTITTTGAQAYGDAVLLRGDTVLNAGAGVTFAGTLDSDTTARALTVNTGGTTTFGGAVGGTASGQLASLTTDAGGTTAINGGTIRTSGAQSYNDAVTLGSDTVLTGSAGGFTTVAGGGFDLALDFAGTTAIDGGLTGIRNLSTTGGGITRLQGLIATSGAQNYGEAVVLAADTMLTGTAGTFASTVTGGGFDLSLDFSGATRIDGGFTGIRNLATGPRGTTTLQGAITTSGAQAYGNAVLLGASTVLTGTSGSFASTVAGGGFDLSLDFAGTTAINGDFTGIRNLAIGNGGTTRLQGAITTSGTQTFGDAVVLGGDTVLNAGANAIGFARTVDGGFALTANSGGVTSFAGAVGRTQALAALTTDGAGTTAINGGTITTVGAQTYADAVTIGADSVLAGGSVGFGQTVDGARALAVNAAGLTRFGGVVGGAQKLVSLTTDAAGSTLLAGGGIGTSGAQNYGDIVTLGADTPIDAAGGVRFAGTVDGGFALAVASGAATVFDGAVGTAQRLASLATDGAGTTAINGGTIATTGAQSYGDTVSLGAATLLDGGAIGFARTVDGGFALTANSAGLTRFGGIVGGTQALTMLTTDAAGTTAIDGGAITTTGTQAFADAITLGADTVLIGSAGSLAGVSGNGHDLRLAYAGGGMRGGGGIAGVNGLAIQAAGIDLSGQTVTANSATLDGGGGALAAGTLDIANNLVGTGGSVAIGGASARSGSLALRATAGGLTLGTSRVGTTARLSATGGDLAVTRLDAGGAVTLESNRSARLGDVVATAGDVSAMAAGGEISGLGTGAANIRASGAINLVGGTLARLGTVEAGTTLTASAATITAGSATATRDALSLTASGGDLTIGGGRVGTTATLTARDGVSIGVQGAGLSARTITVSSSDLALGGANAADSMLLTNTGGGRMRLGNAGGAGYALDEAEFRTIASPSLRIDNKAGDIAIGDLALADGAGSTSLFFATTGRLDISGRISGAGPGGATPAADAPLRTLRFGGSTSDTNAMATTITIAPTASAGGRLIFTGNTALDLRATRIGAGQEAGFLGNLGLLPATTTPLPTETVVRDFVSNANSTLYNSANGGTPYTDLTVLKANTLSVRFGEFALFQNTARPGSAPAAAGIELQSMRLPTLEAIVVGQNAGASAANGFALFGTINNQNGSGAAALGGQTVALDGINPNNSRVNGCLVNSGTGGCLISIVAPPQLQIFDRSQANILRNADDLALAFDPVIGTNNESLFSDVGAIDLPDDVPAGETLRCDSLTDPSCTDDGARAL